MTIITILAFFPFLSRKDRDENRANELARASKSDGLVAAKIHNI